MDKSTFRITISGKGVLPETTRAGDLAELLTDIEKAICKTGEGQGVEVGEEEIISLTGVERSSNKLTFTVAGILASSVAIVSEAVDTKRYEMLPRLAHEALHEVSKQAVKRRWEVRFNGDEVLGIKDASISEQAQVPPAPPPAYIEGTTTIYGRCIRVGGIKPRAEIRLHLGGSLFIAVSEQLAKELAKNLYEHVCIEGRARWNPEDWSIEEFEGERVLEFKAPDVLTAFNELATAASGRWEGVDVVAYVEGLRSEGEDT
jgi:hypothetical protein